MGQEVGHAYEDLFELVLKELLPRLEKRARTRLRVSPLRRMSGVTGNIDHLVEASADGSNWAPFCLFMEKHSDSADESHKHLRRHLEEYVQAKVSSVLLHGFPVERPLRVVNLIFGTKSGWKPEILKETKRLLHPSLFLMDEPYYERLNSIVTDAIAECRAPYTKTKIRRALQRRAAGESSVQKFAAAVGRLLMHRGKPPKPAADWIAEQIAKARSAPSQDTLDIPVAYVRKAMTELLVLVPQTRTKICRLGSGERALERQDAWTTSELRALQLACAGLELRPSITGVVVVLPTYLSEFCQQPRHREALAMAEDLLLSSPNRWSMTSSDYLAYFDLRDDHFPRFVRDSLVAIERLVNGRANAVTALLRTRTPLADAVTSCPDRAVARVQNLALEAVMAIASMLGKESAGTRNDLSTAALAKFAGCSEAKIQAYRGASQLSDAQASTASAGIGRFVEELALPRRQIVEWLRSQLADLERWRSAKAAKTLVTRPLILNPRCVMSLAWFRHNQLNSHSVFNPLCALVYLDHRRAKPSGSWQAFGFPERRSANLVHVIPNWEHGGADYEFSIVFLNALERKVHIVETCSVINLKHTSDKCKELAAKVRAAGANATMSWDLKFELVLDGDWTAEHVRDLRAAGWHRVTFSTDYLSGHSGDHA